MKFKDLSRPIRKIGTRLSILKKVGQPPGTLVYTGKEPVKPTRLELIQYDTGQISSAVYQKLDMLMDQINEKNVTWIHINNLNNTTLFDEIGKIFRVHALTLEDILNTEHLPKVEESDDHLFLTLKRLFYNGEGELTETHVSLILHENILISFADSQDDIFKNVKSRLDSDKSRARSKESDYLFYLLVDSLVDNYYLVLDVIYNQLETIEMDLMEFPNRNYTGNIHQVKTDLVFIRKSLLPLEKIMNTIIKDEFDFMADENEIFFKDVYDHVMQLVQTYDSYRDFITSLIELNSSNMNNNLNRTMKILTIIATIFIPLTFIAGIYGMNFKFMPELSWRYGYFVVLGIMLIMGTGMIFYMKRKGFF